MCGGERRYRAEDWDMDCGSSEFLGLIFWFVLQYHCTLGSALA